MAHISLTRTRRASAFPRLSPRVAVAILRTIWWGGMSALTALLISNALPFFSFSADEPFLIEKGALVQQPLWRTAFYLHVGGGILCLLSALPQFSRTLLRRAPRLHRAMGWTYVVSVLVLVVPAGLYLALTAKGGFAGRLGFLSIGFVLLYVTWRGVQRVRARDFRGHASWMLRSYAMAASAITFRVFYLGLYALGVGNEYVLGIWMSLLVNAFVVEVLIHRTRVRRTASIRSHA